MDLISAIALVGLVFVVSLMVIGLPTLIISNKLDEERRQRFTKEYFRGRYPNPEIEKMDRFLNH